MRLVVSVLMLLALVACETNVPSESVSDKSPTQTETVMVDPDADPVVAAEDAAKEENKVVINNDNPTISTTQDFKSLKEQETIESDKARLKAQREKFVTIAPTALPTRSNSANVAAFALQTKNNVGEMLYSRGDELGVVAASQACSRFRLPDDAQASFLRSGGPSGDPGNLDPDGDGFACDWSPETYRKLLK
jgi:hypothetical protein